jgi:hypothetical protein
MKCFSIYKKVKDTQDICDTTEWAVLEFCAVFLQSVRILVDTPQMLENIKTTIESYVVIKDGKVVAIWTSKLIGNLHKNIIPWDKIYNAIAEEKKTAIFFSNLIDDLWKSDSISMIAK